MMVMTVLLLLEGEADRTAIHPQKDNDNSKEGGESEADNEANLDVVVPRGVTRELSLDKNISRLVNAVQTPLE